MATPWLLFAASMAFAMALPADANELEGVWLFQHEINTTATGDVVEIPGPAHHGVLIYKLEELRQTVSQGSSTVMPAATRLMSRRRP